MRWSLLSYLCLSVFLCGRASAAPPTLTYLYPAGAQRGTTVEVTAGGTFERWPVQVWVEGKGLEVKPAKDKGKLTVTVAADAVPGPYWLRLYDEEGATALRTFLVGTLPEVMEQEPNDDAKKPQMIDGNVIVNGRLAKAGDVDCYGLKLKKGQTLVASLEANRTLGSPMDGLLQILSADGFVLEQNNDYHGLDPQIVFPVPKDGTYVVRTFAFPSMPDASIHFAGGENYVYRLTLTTAGFADHPWPLAVPRADPGTVELVGWNIPEDARKVAVAKSEEAITSVFHSQIANPVTVRPEPHATTVADAGNDRHHPQTLTIPMTVSGRLEKADAIHAYSFEAKKGQKLLFQAEAQALGYPLTPVLRLLDSKGKQLAQAEGPTLGHDPELVFSVPEDGKYSVEIRDLHGDGSPRHLYRLRAIFAVPEFSLTLTSDRFVMTPGKPLDVILTVVRRNDFVEGIDVSAEGLPEGITAAPVAATMDAKTITLQLTAGAAPAAGPLRIVGKVRGTQEPSHLAQTPLADRGVSTYHLWITLPRPPEKK